MSEKHSPKILHIALSLALVTSMVSPTALAYAAQPSDALSDTAELSGQVGQEAASEGAGASVESATPESANDAEDGQLSQEVPLEGESAQGPASEGSDAQDSADEGPDAEGQSPENANPNDDAARPSSTVSVAVPLHSGITGTLAQDGVIYAVDDKEATVIGWDASATGTVTVPGTVRYEGRVFLVTAVDVPAPTADQLAAEAALKQAVKDAQEANDAQALASAQDALAKAQAAKPQITHVSLPGTVNSIGSGLLGSLPALETVTVSTLNKEYASYDGALYGKGRAALMLVPQAKKSIEIAAEATDVPAGAFASCAQLESIAVAAGSKAFGAANGMLYSSDLTKLAGTPPGIGASALIAESCTTVLEGAFAGCEGISSVIAPGLVTEVEDGAFPAEVIEGAIVALPAGAGEEAKKAWQQAGFTKFAEIAQPGATQDPEGQEGEGAPALGYKLLDDYTLAAYWAGAQAGATPIEQATASAADVEIPAYAQLDGVTYPVTAIAARGFENAAVSTVEIPASVTVIGDWAFQGSSLRSVALPASVEYVGASAFADCASLEAIVAASDIGSVSESAIAGCSGVTVYVPYRADGAYPWTMGLLASANQVAPYGISLPADALKLKEGESASLYDEGAIQLPAAASLSYAYSARTVSVDAATGAVTAVSEGASEVTLSITLAGATLATASRTVEVAAGEAPATDEVISQTLPITNALGITSDDVISQVLPIVSTFGLTSADMVNQTLPLQALNLDDEDPSLDTPDGREDAEGAEEIEPELDEETRARLVELDATVDGVVNGIIDQGYCGPDAPEDGEASLLATDQGTTGKVSWQVNASGTLRIYGNGTMGSYNARTETGNGTGNDNRVTGAPWGKYWNEITAITIESGVTSITAWVFCGLTKAKTLSIANTVTTIGEQAFNWCSGLTGTVVIPDSVTTVGKYAFTHCDSVTAFQVGTGVTTIGAGVFGDTPPNAKWPVPIYVRSSKITKCGGTWFTDGRYVVVPVDSGNVTLFRSTNNNGGEGLSNWKIGHKVTFNANGGNALTGADASRIVIEGKAYGALPVPTRTGHTFAGWNTIASGTGTPITADTTFNVTNDTSAGDQILYAQWTPETYKVTYNANNGQGAPAEQVKTYNQTLTLSSQEPTREGYTFKGWNTAQNGTGTSYAKGASYTANAALTLYAQWTINQYTLTVNPNGGMWNNTTASSTVKQNYGTTYTVSDPVRTGHTFKNWTLSGSGNFNAGNKTFTFGAGDGTLTANWTLNTYTVTFVANGGSSVVQQTVKHGEKASEPTEPTKANYRFDGWCTDSALSAVYDFGTPVTNDITLYADWDGLYTVRLINGGDVDDNSLGIPNGKGKTGDSVECLVVPNPPGSRYQDFLGWNTAEDGSGIYLEGDAEGVEISNLSTTPGDVITIYAVWKGKKVSVTYDANATTGVSGSTPASVHYFGEDSTLSQNGFSRTGYTFSGWNTETGGTGTYYAAGATVNNMGEYDIGNGLTNVNPSVTLYAQWTPNTDTPYTIEHYYQVSGVYPTSADSKVLQAGTTEATTTLTPEQKAPVAGREGYVVDESAANVLEATIAADGSTVFKVYFKQQFTVTFKPGDHAAEGSADQVFSGLDYNAAMPTPQDFAPSEDYAFVGWDPEPMSTVTESAVYTAKWAPNTYIVKYDLNGGVAYGEDGELLQGGLPDEKKTLGDSFELPSADSIKKIGYVLSGWLLLGEDGLETSTLYQPGETVDDLATEGNVTVALKAKWSVVVNVAVPTNQHIFVQEDSQGRTQVVEGWSEFSSNTVVPLALTQVESYTLTDEDVEDGGGAAAGALSSPARVELLMKSGGEELARVSLKSGGDAATLDGDKAFIIPAGNGLDGDEAAFGVAEMKFDLDLNGATLRASLEEARPLAKLMFTVSALEEADDAEEPYEVTAKAGVGGDIAPKGVSYVMPGYSRSFIITPHENYEFAGLALVEEGGEPVDVTDQMVGNTYTIQNVQANCTVTATFTPKNFTVKWVNDDRYVLLQEEEYAYGDMPSWKGGTPVASLTPPAGHRYEFVGWTPDVATVIGDAVYAATYEAVGDDYTVSFDLGYATDQFFEPITVTHGKTYTYLPDPEARVGYDFAGWYTEAQAGTLVRVGSVVDIVADHILVAHWTPKSHELSFDVDGGEAMAPQQVAYESKPVVGTPSRTAYDFSHWVDEDGVRIDHDTWTMPNAPAVWKAVWTPTAYTIEYNLDGGRVSSANPGSYDVTTPEFTLANPTKTGYTFAGWTGTDLEGVTETVVVPAGSTGDRSYTATWTTNTYTVTFNPNGGEGSMDAQQLTYGTAATLSPNQYSKEGYGFFGWNTTADGSGTSYVDEASVLNLSAENGGSVVLYAQWDTSFAVFSADDASLTFYGIEDFLNGVPATGGLYGGKTATAVFTGFDSKNYSSFSNVPWSSYRKVIETVSFASEVAPTSTAFWFYEFGNCTNMDLGKLDTSKAISMSNMFYGCTDLESLDLGHFDTSSTTNMSQMFQGCLYLANLNLSNFITSKVTNMSSMFRNCLSLSSLDLGGFDTNVVSNMSYMFYGCSDLEYLNLSSFNTPALAGMSYMFYNCSSLASLDLGGFITTRVGDMSYLFSGCSSLTSLDLGRFATTSVSNMGSMFAYCSSLRSLDLSTFSMSRASILSFMFSGCSELEKIYVSNKWILWSGTDTATEVTPVDLGMFSGCVSLVGGNGTVFDPMQDTSLYARIDGGPESETPGYLSSVPADLITFKLSFNGGSPDASNVPDPVTGEGHASCSLRIPTEPPARKGSIFGGWALFDAGGSQLAIYHPGDAVVLTESSREVELTALWRSSFAVYSADDASLTFYGLDAVSGGVPAVGSEYEGKTATSVYVGFDAVSYSSNLDVPWFAHSLDIESVTFAGDVAPLSTAYWFYGFKNCTQVDIAKLNTRNTLDMSSMFEGCSKLDTLNASNMDVSKARDMSYMFADCASLASLDLQSFRALKAEDMTGMFDGCTSLVSLEFEDFDASKVVGMSYMFADCSSLESLDLSSFNTSSVTDMSYMFYKCTKLISVDLRSFDTSSVTDMSFMFRNCQSLASLDLSSFYTPRLERASYMLAGCAFLGSVDLPKFVTSNVTDMSYMFYACSRISVLDLSSFDASSVTDSRYMFFGCSALQRIYASSDWGRNANDGSMFTNCTSLVGGKGTAYDFGHTSGYYARIDGGPDSDAPGYFSIANEEQTAFKLTYVGGAQDVSNVPDAMTGVGQASYSFTIPVDTPVREGHIFVGWEILNPDGSHGATYQPGDAVVLTVDKNEAVLIALWGSSFAVYSADDASLTFYGADALREGVPSAGDDYEGKVATDVYVGFDATRCQDRSDQPWGEHREAVRSVSFAGEVSPVSTAWWFHSFVNCVQMDLAKLDTSNVTDMSYMFYGCFLLGSLDLLSFDTSSVIDMSYMFTNSFALTALDLSSFKTPKVTNIDSMFSGCTSLTFLDLSGFTTSGVTDMSSLFTSCKALTSLDLSSFDTSNVLDMSIMFAGCSSLVSVDLSSFDTSKVKDLSAMFDGCSSLASVDISSFNTTGASYDMSYMFNGCPSLRKIYVAASWNSSCITDGITMFLNCSSLVGGSGTAYDPDKTDGAYARIDGGPGSSTPGYFTAAPNKQTTFKLSFDGGAQGVMGMPASMTGTGGASYSFTISSRVPVRTGFIFVGWAILGDDGSQSAPYQPGDAVVLTADNNEAVLTALWGLSFAVYSADDDSLTFYGYDAIREGVPAAGESYEGKAATGVYTGFDAEVCSSELDVPWHAYRESIESVHFVGEASPVSTAWWFYKFRNCTSMDLKKLDTSNVTSMASMFDSCSSLESLDVSGFDTSNVTDMSYMFFGCTKLAALNLSSFGTSSVTSMTRLFAGCSSLESLDLSGFETPSVTDMSNMFADCVRLTSLDVSSFDTSSVTNMSSMFVGCSSLKSLDVSGFKTSNVTTMATMFFGCASLTSLDVAGLDTSNVTIMYSMFEGCSRLILLDISSFSTAKLKDARYMFYGCSFLQRIYASDLWVPKFERDSTAMFYGCNALVGGNGTVYNSSNISHPYDRIDGGPDSLMPGYFTEKDPSDSLYVSDGGAVLLSLAGDVAAFVSDSIGSSMPSSVAEGSVLGVLPAGSQEISSAVGGGAGSPSNEEARDLPLWGLFKQGTPASDGGGLAASSGPDDVAPVPAASVSSAVIGVASSEAPSVAATLSQAAIAADHGHFAA